ncbi:hypothetical protein DCC77_04215 [Candidatus Uhrbacteria bacterium]|nr:MAG: hypothetical protein DCC77_04215 [Candidatus Uhrbacteria bacterium]
MNFSSMRGDTTTGATATVASSLPPPARVICAMDSPPRYVGSCRRYAPNGVPNMSTMRTSGGVPPLPAIANSSTPSPSKSYAASVTPARQLSGNGWNSFWSSAPPSTGRKRRTKGFCQLSMPTTICGPDGVRMMASVMPSRMFSSKAKKSMPRFCMSSLKMRTCGPPPGPGAVTISALPSPLRS